jgi:Leucine-rich repeat (LRR) protein
MILTLEKATELMVNHSLDISSMLYTEIEALPDGLIYLYCYLNELKKLPPLPETLKDLYCSHNELESLPTLPNLRYLDCSENRLTDLPILPDNLGTLICSGNRLYGWYIMRKKFTNNEYIKYIRNKQILQFRKRKLEKLC